MTGQNGAVQAAGTVCCVIGVIILFWSVQNFMQKSKIVDLIISREIVKSNERQRLHHIAAYVFLYLGIISLLLGFFFLLNKSVFAVVASGLGLSGVLIILIRVLTGHKE